VARSRWQTGSITVVEQKRGKYWMLRFNEYLPRPNGTLRRVRRKVNLGSLKKIPNKRTARLLAQPYMDAINKAAPVKSPAVEAVRQLQQPSGNAAMTYRDFFPRWHAAIVTKKSKGTQRVYRAQFKLHIEPVLGGIRLCDIDTLLLQDLVTLLENKGLDADSIRLVMAVISGSLKSALAWKFIEVHPMKGVVLPRATATAKKPFSIGDTQSILNHAQCDADRLEFYLWAETGCRIGESCALNVEDVDLLRKRLSINQSINKWNEFTDTKNHSPRSLAISTFLTETLRQHIGDRTSGPLFPARESGKHQNPGTPAKRLKKALNTLNITGSAHIFRHSNASLMDELGIPSKMKKDRLGHSTRSDITLHVYTHHQAKVEAEVAEKICEALLSLVNEEEPAEDLSRVKLQALTSIIDPRMVSLLGSKWSGKRVN
jgi:integrase